MESVQGKLNVDQIFPHPDNPRKDLGDLEELKASISEHGILQDITVIPRGCLTTPKEEQDFPDVEGEFYVLLGHRRLAAYRIVKHRGTIKCKIVWGLSRSEQIGLMMEENVQRNDLTVPEQIESFQLMLDLGETVETVSQKTGFSKSTIYKRIKNSDVVDQIKESDHQFTIDDLAELAKIPTEKKENVLKHYGSSSTQIKQGVDNALREIKREEGIKKTIELLEAAGVREYDPDIDGEWYNLDYVGNEQPGECKGEYGETDVYKRPTNSWENLMIRRVSSDEEETEEDRLEEETKKREEEEHRRKLGELEAGYKKIEESVIDFLKDMIENRKETETGASEILDVMTECDLLEIDLKETAAIMNDKSTWENDAEDVLDLINKYDPSIEMFMYCDIFHNANKTFNYRRLYDEEDGKIWLKLIELLRKEHYDLPYPREEMESILDGTSELYEGGDE